VGTDTAPEAGKLFRALDLLRQSARTSEPLRDTVDCVELAITTARAFLGECLWDERLWEPERLVSQMEVVYEHLGGSLLRPPEEGARGN